MRRVIYRLPEVLEAAKNGTTDLLLCGWKAKRMSRRSSSGGLVATTKPDGSRESVRTSTAGTCAVPM